MNNYCSLIISVNTYEDSNCAGDIQEIFDYIKIGEENIQIPPTPDTIIVVGLSGVGKSTLVQFIGNFSNQLVAACDRGGNCLINDETGTIGDNLISKTFLPNLVVDQDTNTSYFDMPGFNDNRNATIEIANSYFMMQALNSSQRIKILLLARQSSFSVNDKQTMFNLMNNFVNLFENPGKLTRSIAMIATIADPTKTHDQRIFTYTDFLELQVKPAVDTVFDPTKARLVNETIDAILALETGSPDDAKYLGYFVSPTENGSLHELPNYVDNYERLIEIVHKNLEFSTTSSDDFGIPLTDTALLLLERAHDCIHEAFVALMELAGTSIEDIVMENVVLITSYYKW